MTLLKPLIKHQVQNSISSLCENSVLNNGTEGYSTVVLDTTPGRVLTLHLTDPDNRLWMNESYYKTIMTIPAHYYEGETTVIFVSGGVTLNFLTQERSVGGVRKGKFRKNMHRYDVSYDGDVPTYSNPTPYDLYYDGKQSISYNRTAFKVPNDRLIVPVCHNRSVWLTITGGPNPNYTSGVYSNRKLERNVKKDLYVKPSANELINLLSVFNLYSDGTRAS